MVKYEEKFLVVKWSKISDNLAEKERQQLGELISKATASRDFFSEVPHKYYVCNQDERYAKKVFRIIIRGEKIKELKNHLREKIDHWLFCSQCGIDHFLRT